MPKLQYIPLSKVSFEQSDWQTLLASISEKNCENYYSVFFQKAGEAQKNGDIINEEIFTLLGAVSSLLFKPDSTEIFHPLWVFYDPPSRSFMIEDFTDEYIAVLAEIAPDVYDAEMRARLADIAWVKGRSKYYSSAKLAANSYVESARSLLNTSVFKLGIDLRLKRALALANSIRNRELLDSILDEIEKIIVSCQKNDYTLPYTLLRLLLNYPCGNPASFSELSKNLAEYSEQQHNWIIASSYWQMKSEWDTKDNNLEAKHFSLIQSAESLVKAGKAYANAEQPNYHAARFQLMQALEIFRSIGGMRSKCEEIHLDIISYQQLIISDFKHYRTSYDIRDFVYQSQQSVSGKSFKEAIFILAFSENPTNVQDLKASVEEAIKLASFHNIFPIAIVDNQGFTTATSSPVFNSTDEQMEKIIRTRMFMQAKYHYDLIVSAIIAPITYQISLDHYIQIDDLEFLVLYNSFIPPQHAYIFLKGLYAGFRGDFLVASHLLIPQIENSVRYILNQRKIITSSLNTKTGVQENFTLDTLLEMPILEEILGADIVFDLQALLIRRFGSNLRNRLSHGLMESSEFESEINIYLWWLVLRLCYHGVPLDSYTDEI